jgi:CheY-like chemotaxis protein
MFTELITERKRAEEEHGQLLAQKRVTEALVDVARRKDEFLAMLAHELRNPLAPMTLAVELMRESSPADLGLPSMDGIEVAQRLRRTSAGSRPLLVAVTGFGRAEDRARTAAAGFDYHLTKPVDPEVVRSLVQNVSVRAARAAREA